MRIYAVLGTLFYGCRYIFRSFFLRRLVPSLAAVETPAETVAPPPGPRLTKVTRKSASEANKLEFAVSEMQGWRDAMEDAHIAVGDLEISAISDSLSVFGVFDGHGGAAASRLCAEFFVSDFQSSLDFQEISDALTRTYAVLDERLLAAAGAGAFDYTGSTAVVLVVQRDAATGSRWLTVANAGDSRAVLCREGRAIELSHDHKPESPRERQRIEKAGGRVTAMGPCYRVDWGLNLSRSLGDFAYKKNESLEKHQQKISGIPDIVREEVGTEDEFVLLGCDGIFELLSSQEVVDFVRAALKRNIPLERTVEMLLDECCAKDPNLTLGRGTDNETCLLVKFL